MTTGHLTDEQRERFADETSEAWTEAGPACYSCGEDETIAGRLVNGLCQCCTPGARREDLGGDCGVDG